MTLDELKDVARRILAIQPAAGFDHITFETKTGGYIHNPLGIPEVHVDREYRYETHHGAAYAGTLTVECRDTGAKSARGRTIYETPSGVVFVFVYRPGAAEYFDSGRLCEPKLN